MPDKPRADGGPTDKPKLRISCKVCGQEMVERTNKVTGGAFLGCSRWPDCTETQPLPVYVTLMRSGASQLPGFEEA